MLHLTMRHSQRGSIRLLLILKMSRLLARLWTNVVPSTIFSISMLWMFFPTFFPMFFPMLRGPRFLLAQNARPGNSAPAQMTKVVGTIKTIETGLMTVAAEAGGDVTAKLSDSTKILRVPPGEKDLKNAVALQPQDLQAGDRVLVRGQASADGRTIAALAVIVMKQSDVAAKNQQERDDWQKRGVGGLVTKVDRASSTITISSGGLSANKSIAVKIGKSTMLRRYAPGSVRFDDAKPEPASDFMAQTKPGDQMRARGTKSPDGGEISAEEVVAGSFRNIAGPIKAVDAGNKTITVQDAISKSAVVVNISSDSQMKKLSPEMAQRIAARLKSTPDGNGAPPSTNGQRREETMPGRQGPPTDMAAPKSGPDSKGRGDAASSGAAGAPGGNGPPDLQRVLSRLPSSTLADLQKSDVVMIVASEGAGSESATVITLLAGVEPILTAAPDRSASSLLSPWSLSAPGGESESAQ
jgi:hypothetical protein